MGDGGGLEKIRQLWGLFPDKLSGMIDGPDKGYQPLVEGSVLVGKKSEGDARYG